MRGNKRTIAILVAGLALGLPLNTKAQQPDPEKARTERKIVSYGQPDDWQTGRRYGRSSAPNTRALTKTQT